MKRFCTPFGVELAADDVVADARQVLDAASPDHDDRVLLEVVADAGDVARDLDVVGQPDPGDLPHGRVRLLGRRREDPGADAPLLGAGVEGRRFALVFLGRSGLF